MINRIKDFFFRHRQFFYYVVISVGAALIDYVVGWFFLDSIGVHILVANSLAIFVSAVFHFLVTSRLVFHVNTDISGFLIYAITFAFGFLLQNTVIYIFYEHFLRGFETELNYLISKGLSLTLPFVLVFLLRKYLNAKFGSLKEADHE